MNSVESIRRICSLPADIRRGRKSPYELVHGAGIEPRTLTTASVTRVLRSNSELVTDWLHWSEDKRSTAGYYFLEEKGGYVVGHYPDEDRVEFDDPIAACADFIVKEVNSIW